MSIIWNQLPFAWLAWIGLASALLSTIAYLPYIIETARGHTQPQRASWLIWSVLGALSFFSQVHEGATDSLWFAGVQVSGTIIVFVMSLFVGRGRLLSARDYAVLALAAFGLYLWHLTDTAAYALVIAISVSLLGGVVTMAKAYARPDSETLATWTLSGCSAFLAMIAVGTFDPLLLAYPVYLFALNTGIVLAIHSGRMRDRIATA